MSYKLNPFTGKLDNTGTEPVIPTVPASIDDLNDVDTSTVAPTDGQVLVWDNANSQWEPGTISTSGGGGTTDALASYVTLLVDGDTGITDSSTSARAITVSGSSASSSTYSKAGGGSVHKTASSYLSIPNDPAIVQWHNRPGGYCIDYWIYNPGTNWTGFSSPSSTNTSVVIGDLNPTGGANYWGFGPNDSGVPVFYWYPGGAAGTAIVGTTTLSLNTWHHLAVSIDTGNSTMRLFVDGVQEATSTSYSGTYGGGPLIIGQLNNVSPEFYIDHLRITTGNPRFTSNFNPADELPSTGGGSTTTLPTPTTDGKALIVENGQWVEGPVIGGYNYSVGATNVSTYTVPTGFSIWGSEFTSADDANNSPSPNVSLSGSNRIATSTATGNKHAISTVSKSSGKWYWEIEAQNLGSNGDAWIGIVTNIYSAYPGQSGTAGFGIRESGQVANDLSNSTTSGSASSFSSNDIVMFALDLDTKKLWQGVNGVWANSGDPAAGTGVLLSNWNGTPDFYYAMRLYYTSNAAELKTYITTGTTYSQPYTIDNLDDVDISTAAPTNGQALVWNSTDGKFKPGTVSGGGSSLPAANDGEALIYENGQWVAGPVVGGVNYSTSVISARYWRLTNITVPDTSFGLEARQITLFTSNTETLTAGDYGPFTYSVSDLITPTTNMTFHSGSTTAISDNSSTIFAITNSELGGTGAYLQWDLGSAQAVTHIATHLRDNSTRFIDSADVEYSSDGTNWTSAGSFSGVTASGTERWSTYGAFNSGSTTTIVATGERKTSSVTTSSLATNASADVTLPLTGKAGQFVSVTVDYPAWVVFYTDAAARTADASRAQTTDALPGSGVLLEVATSTANETVVVTPSSGYFNNESTPVSELSIKVVNLDSVSRAITVDAKVIPLEA